MKIYDFDVDDELLKVENNLQNVEIVKNSFADYRAEYRKLAQDISIDLRVLSDCVDSYERALLIGVYTYAEQLVKNFYYQLLEKDQAQNVYVGRYIDKKLDPEKFSPNVNYEFLEKSIKEELFPGFRFIIKKNRAEISKYDDIIKNRHRYAHGGVYQSNIEQFCDVINVEKYITLELRMIVERGKDYRIQYQNDWIGIKEALKDSYGLYMQFKGNHNVQLKRRLIDKIRELRDACRAFYRKYISYIDDCTLLEGVKQNIVKINELDLRKTATFSVLEELDSAIKKSNLFIAEK